jgi:predicted permease
MPVFIVMVLGYILSQIGFLSDEFINIGNKLVFKVTLPVLLFTQMASIDIYSDFDSRYVFFCAFTTSVSFFGIWILAHIFIKNKKIIGEFVQASYRSSAAILGAAYITNIYGNAGMLPLMMIGSVPLFNIYAVLVLTLESPQQVKDGQLKKRLLNAFVNILKNPIIDSIALGLVSSALRLKFPVLVNKSMSSVASMTTPLSLIAIGGSFSAKNMFRSIKYTTVVSTIKLLVLPAIFLPIAVKLGFTDQKLVALMVMLGGCSTPTCYVMAQNMGHEGTLSSGAVVMTTLFSTVTLTFWIFIARVLGYII